jgi:hypothetical protein
MPPVAAKIVSFTLIFLLVVPCIPYPAGSRFTDLTKTATQM